MEKGQRWLSAITTTISPGRSRSGCWRCRSTRIGRGEQRRLGLQMNIHSQTKASSDGVGDSWGKLVLSHRLDAGAPEKLLPINRSVVEEHPAELQ